MQTLASLDLFSSRNTTPSQGSDNSFYRNSRYQGNDNGNGHGGRGRGGRGGYRSSRNHDDRSLSRDAGSNSSSDTTTQRTEGRLDNDATCPIHGGHQWGSCFLNPRGDSYRPYYNRGSGRDQGGRNPDRGPPMPNGYQANDAPNVYHAQTSPSHMGTAPGSDPPGDGFR